MIITFISDTHNRHERITSQLPGGDLLIHAGDLTDQGTELEIFRFLDWFEELPYKHKIFVPGNHDFYFENILKKKIAQEELEKIFKKFDHYPTIVWITDDMIELEGIKIYGSPWQPAFGGWAFNLPRDGEELKAKWDKIPAGLDILITHGPPFGRGDKLEDGREVGDQLLLDAILEKKPAINVFGHIHAGRGLYESPDTVFINASIVNEQYRPIYEPITVDYNPSSKTFITL